MKMNVQKMCCIFLFAVLISALLSSGPSFSTTESVAYASSGTEVSGIIWENTTWTLENSPYIITDTIQIPENVTLNIEPGVTVIFSGEGNMFLVHGSVYAHGTPNNKIVFDGGGVTEYFFSVDYGSPDFFDLEYCQIKNGNKLFQGHGDTKIVLRHSEIENIQSYSELNMVIGENYIEYNIFNNAAGFRLYDFWERPEPGVSHYIRYNLVKDNRGFFVKAITNDLNTVIVLKYNSFIDINGIVLEIGGNYIAVDATENYWGTNSLETIDEMIYDAKDDIRCPGIINYNPILTSPHPEAPTLPITVNIQYSPVVLYANVTAVDFDATASFGEYSSIANYTWDFGDGTVVTLDVPITAHTFVSSGEYNVTLTVTDEYGFQNGTSTNITVLEDATPPVTADDYDGAWHTSDFTITLTAVDEGSGVAETYYRINDGPTRAVSADGHPVIAEEGADNKLEYWSVDYAGNEEPHKVLTGIKLDKTAPIIRTPVTIPEDDVQADQDVIVSVEVFDSISGVERVTLSYSIDNGSTWENLPANLNSTSGRWEATIPGQEIWTTVNYKILAYDYAGNNASSNGANIYYEYQVISEFPSWMPLLITLVAVVAVAVIYRRKLRLKEPN